MLYTCLTIITSCFFSDYLVKKIFKSNFSVPGFVNACYTTYYSHKLIYNCPQVYFNDNSCIDNNIVNHLVLVTTGYSCYEMLNAIMNNDKIYVLHGGLSFLGCCYYLYNNKCYLITIAHLMETSTILLNIMLINKTYLNKLLFFLTFMVYRLGIIFSYSLLNFNKFDYVYKSFILVFNSLNFFWGYKLILYARKKY